jgi:hypothetical protein
MSRNRTKYMRVYYISFGLKKATIWGQKVNLPSDYTSVVTLKTSRQPQQSLTIFTHMCGDQPWMDVRLPPLSTIKFVDLNATISSLKVSTSGARLLQVALGWPRMCSTRYRRRCYKTSSTLALTRIHRRKLCDSQRCVV